MSRSSAPSVFPRLPRMKDLPVELRPRERFLTQGAGALSTAELLAVVLGTGARTRSALDVATDLLGRHGSLGRLAGASPAELCETRGVGRVKALHLLAAFELGRRLSALPPQSRPSIRTPADVAAVVMDDLRFCDREHFVVLLLNTRHDLVGKSVLTRGGLASSPVHPRELFKAAVRESAAAVILVHNHPSGDPTPSRADLVLTARLCQAGRVMGIPIVDHVIIGDRRYESLRQRGVSFDSAPA